MIAMHVPVLGSFQEGQLVLVASITSTVEAEMYQLKSLFSDGTADIDDKRIEFSEKLGFAGQPRWVMWSFPPSWKTSDLFVPTDVIELENGLSARVGDPVWKKKGLLSKRHGTIEALFIRGDQKDAVVQVEFDDQSKALFSKKQIIPGKKGHQIGK